MSIMNFPLLKIGSYGAAVIELQRRLSAHDLAVKIDGFFGAETKRYVIAFQKSQHIAADGIVGPVTWRYLYRSS
jgi:peptidoglycan hydrolase-like protein with peptidoglycan-binding domain